MKSCYTVVLTMLYFLLIIPVISFSQSLQFNLLWQQPVSRVQAIKFSPDAKIIVTGNSQSNCYDCGQIDEWRVRDSTLSKTITNELMGVTNDLDLTSNGNNIISGHGSVVCDEACHVDRPGQFQYIINGTLKKYIDSNDIIYAIRYSPDNSLIAAGTGYNNTGVIRIYDTAYNLIRELPGHQYETNGLAFTPDGKYLVSGGEDGLVKVWNYKTGALIRTMTHGTYLDGGAYINVDVSPNGKYIASSGLGYNITVKIWRVSDGQLIYTFPVKGIDSYAHVKFSPDGNYVAAGAKLSGNKGYYGKVFVWQLSDGSLIKQIVDTSGGPSNAGIQAIAFSPVKNYFAYSTNSTVKVFSLNFGNIVFMGNADNDLQTETSKFKSFVFPNPFTVNTTLQFTITKKQFVTIAVYNMDGNKMASLVNEEKVAGTYTVNFNAAKLTSGIYFYKITANSYSEIKKIVLNK